MFMQKKEALTDYDSFSSFLVFILFLRSLSLSRALQIDAVLVPFVKPKS